ncbi:MAG: hypothetical protein DSM106950_06695 [Stigonema ocellatum SAG 48.90 = DSM 106950]|nr:hypothetical protein [Stigonema ocellatum SAG 48.90 = DSM 106950]
MAEQQKNQQPNEENTNTSGGYQTTIEEETRKTGVASKTDAKPTAVPESGTNEQFVEGSPNQGTEKR